MVGRRCESRRLSEWNYTHIPPFLLFHEQGTRANWLLQTKIAVVVLLRLLSNMVLQANTSRLTATQLSSLNGTHVRSKSLWSHSESRFDLKVPLKKKQEVNTDILKLVWAYENEASKNTSCDTVGGLRATAYSEQRARQKLGSLPTATQLKLTLGLFDVVVHKASIMHVRSNYTQFFFFLWSLCQF